MEMKTEACNQHTTNTVHYTGNIVGCETKKDRWMDGMVDRLQARKTGFRF